MSRHPTVDVLGLGAVSVDDILYVAEYPAADNKARVLRRERHCGGLAATALVAAARLGATCAYAGVFGTGEMSEFAHRRLAQEGIDLAHAAHDPQAHIIHAVIVVEEGRQTRTIFFDLNGVVGAHPQQPDAGVVQAARVLLVDHVGVPGMLRAARIAHDAGIPIVADFEVADIPEFPALLALVDHLIVSRAFAQLATGEHDPAQAALRLWTDKRAVVAVTCGAEGVWYIDQEHPTTPRHQPAFAVDVVDSTGCGDVFHGAYAVALVAGQDVAARMRFAAAAAALKATRPGGQSGIPNRTAVEAFVRRSR